jgi:hypothetical protein
MLPIRDGYALSTRRGFLGASFAGLALAVLDLGAASAQQPKQPPQPPPQQQAPKQIKLTEKNLQSYLAAYKDMAKLDEGADPNKPDPKLEAQAMAIVKKAGFASLDEYDLVSYNISLVMQGIDPQSKQFTEPPEQLKKEIAALKADKSVPDADKKQELADLEAALKTARPIQFKENIALVLKYYDKLSSEQG